MKASCLSRGGEPCDRPTLEYTERWKSVIFCDTQDVHPAEFIATLIVLLRKLNINRS
jgi:hypothetical protein